MPSATSSLGMNRKMAYTCSPDNLMSRKFPSTQNDFQMIRTYRVIACMQLGFVQYNKKFTKDKRKRDLVGGFNPFEKYQSKWESPPNRGEHNKSLKPPPRIDAFQQTKQPFWVLLCVSCPVASARALEICSRHPATCVWQSGKHKSRIFDVLHLAVKTFIKNM